VISIHYGVGQGGFALPRPHPYTEPGPERGHGQGMPKNTARPRPLSGAGRGKCPRATVFRGPVYPVTNPITDFLLSCLLN